MRSNVRTGVAYLVVLALFVAGMAAVFVAGADLEGRAAGVAGDVVAPPGPPAEPRGGGVPAESVWRAIAGHLDGPVAKLLLQVLLVVAFARAMGLLFGRFGQPAVVGEMVAGILLGPSLFGAFAPALQGWIFAPDSLGALRLLSQLGVVLFLFVIGVDLDVGHLRQKADAALFVSSVSIVCPLLLGCAAALAVYRELAPAAVPFVPFALFLGVSMSITAFPVLARILEERRLARTAVGAMAIACAAVNDATAWCILPLIVALVRAGGLGGALWTVALTVAFALAIWFVARPALARWLPAGGPVSESRSRSRVATILLFLLGSALVTEAIGIHALFGAFLAGVVMPADPALRSLLKERLETFTTTLLLPLFFAFTGLRTDVRRIFEFGGAAGDGGSDWLIALGLIAVAIAGKLGASSLAARWAGLSWLDAFAVGALMNTRGLVELIVLNLGLDLGILSPRIFAMLVVMALVTTMMTGPLLALVDALRARRGLARAAAVDGA